MENVADDFDQRNINDNTSSNILIELKNSSLFDVATLDKYGVAIFQTDSLSKKDVLRVVEMLNEVVQLDPEGKLLLSFQRIRIINIVNKFITLSYRFEDLIKNFDSNLRRNSRRLDSSDQQDEERKVANAMQEQSVQAITRSISDNLPELSESLADAINLISSHIYIRNSKSIDGLRDKLEETLKTIEEEKKKAQNIVSEIGLLPTKQQINNYSQMFEDDSIKFKNASIFWLLGVLACLIGIICMANLIFEKISLFKDEEIEFLIILNISRLLILSGLFYALAICNKNYKSNKHNQIVNKHRANALASFQAFATSSSHDEKAQSAILLEATHTIFGSQSTGYNSKDNFDDITKLLEVLKVSK